MRSTRSVLVSVVLLLAWLGGCSVTPRDTRASYEPVTDTSATSTPMAQLPAAAGEVISILQSRVGGVLIQRIVLRGDPRTGGENQIVVRVDQNARRSGDVDGPVMKPTATMIASELDENFAGIDMEISKTWNRNSFGPFGYAIGRAPNGVTCLYAWQFAMGRPPRIVDDPVAVMSASSMPTAPTSVRARLCKSGMTEAELVALAGDMMVYPPGSTSPYLDPAFESTAPAGPRDALSAAGMGGGYFLAAKSDAAPDPGPRRARARPRSHPRAPIARVRHRAVHFARAFAPAPAAIPGSVNVPLPPGGAASPLAPAAAANPLLAPLRDLAPAPRAAAAPPDEMPLPPRVASAPRPVNPAPAAAAPAPIPLPN
jgi:hypothetical protein